MFDSSEFREIASGRRQGFGADALRGVLRLAEVIFTAAVRWRNHRFDRGVATIHRAGVPVVSVGNLTLGGTGKTPMVEWLARWFQRNNVRVGLLSRGYGAAVDCPNDEAMELRLSLPGVPHVQDADRAGAAARAIRDFGCEALVLDDGFQHRRLARNLDIVLLDALEPFGFDHVFPRGTLREPLEGLRRADVVLLSRADAIDDPRRSQLWDQIAAYAPDAIRAEAVHAPRALLSASGQSASLQTLREASAAAFCGIGNPAGFRQTLHVCGCRVAGFREFPDHHRYTAADIDALAAWAARLDVSAVVCTRKDLVKLGVDRLGDRPLWAIGIELQFVAGQAAVEQKLSRLIAAPLENPSP